MDRMSLREQTAALARLEEEILASEVEPQELIDEYNKRLEALRSEGFPDFVIQATIDRLAEEKLTGKFNTRKSNLCGGCYTYRSNNGTCLCD